MPGDHYMKSELLGGPQAPASISIASMRDIAGRNAKNATEMAAIDGTDIRPIELDVQSEASAQARRSSPNAGGSTCSSTMLAT
jgi:hypothetical protein